jgi:pimeloyl-ACP methyl ester carboxylesterase
METLAPVLLVHGFGQNRHAWHLPSRSFSNYLARAGFDVFNLDLRGHGRSRHLGALRTSQVADYVREDIPAAVREISRISGGQPLFYIGHSMGGLIGYAAAEALGASLAGLVTLGSPYQFGRGSWPLTVASQLVLRMDALVTLPERAAASLRPLGEAMRLLRGFVESPVFPIRPYAAGSMEPAILGQHLSLAMDAGSFAVLKNLFRDGVESRRTGHRRGGITGYADGFERSSVPLLVIAGTKDELAPPASVYPAYEASRARDRTYRKFPLGHIDLIVGRDAPLSVWPLIESWIRKRVVRAAT